MKFLLLTLILFCSSLYAQNSLLYTVSKGSKNLGHYEINYKKNSTVTHSYGMADKVSYFVDKKIKYLSDGDRDFTFTKNKVVAKFNAKTKLSAIDSKTKKKYERKLKKVEGDDMLLLTKPAKDSIELFNKRKINLLTLDEVLQLVITNKVERKNIVLFDKSGVMKMIAEIVPTATGFDIINKSKDIKYIKVTVKNGIPVEVKSYVSDWALSIYGAGEFVNHEVKADRVNSKAKEFIEKKLSKKSDITLTSVESGFKTKKSDLLIPASIKISYDSTSDESQQKRACKKGYKKYSKKASKVDYFSDYCVAAVSFKVPKKSVIDPIVKELIDEHEQLKITDKVKVTNKGQIMYKLIDKKNMEGN